MKYVIAIFFFAYMFAPAHATEPEETPAQCKKRLGSERQCFAAQITYHQLLCNLKVKGVQLERELGAASERAREANECGGIAKRQIRPFYDALLKVAKKPQAAAAAKKALQAFFAVMADPPGTVGLRNNLETALADLEIELS